MSLCIEFLLFIIHHSMPVDNRLVLSHEQSPHCLTSKWESHDKTLTMHLRSDAWVRFTVRQVHIKYCTWDKTYFRGKYLIIYTLGQVGARGASLKCHHMETYGWTHLHGIVFKHTYPLLLFEPDSKLPWRAHTLYGPYDHMKAKPKVFRNRSYRALQMWVQ